VHPLGRYAHAPSFDEKVLLICFDDDFHTFLFISQKIETQLCFGGHTAVPDR